MEYPYLFAQTPVFSNKLYAKYTILLFRVVMIVTLLAIILNVTTLRVYTENSQVPLIAFQIMGIASLAFVVAYVLLAVFFLLWMNRAYHNLHRAQVENLSYTKGWAIGAWFIPLANFFLPDTIMKEIWDKTQEAFRNEQPFEKKNHSLVSFWWLAYILSGIVKVISYYLMINRVIEGAYVVAIISNVISLFALLYGSRMVRNISISEEEMMERAATIYQAQVAASAKNYLDIINPSYAESIPSVLGEAEAPVQLKENPSPKKAYTLVGDFTDNSERAKFLLIGLKLLVFAAFFLGVICVYMATETKSGDRYEVFQAASRWLDKILWGGLLVLTATFIILIAWMKRAYTNLYHLGIKNFSFSPDAAVYSWFIPGGNLFMPYSILQDINRHMQQEINGEKFPVDKRPANHTIIIVFWLLLLLSGIFLYKFLSGLNQQFSFIFYLQPDITYYAWFGVFAAVAGGIAFYFGIMMVNAISSLESRLFQKLEEAAQNNEIIDGLEEEVQPGTGNDAENEEPLN